MAYASPMKIANGLVLDFTVDNADTAADTFLGLNANGEVTKFASVPRARVSGGGNITETTSSVLTITGGTAAVLTSGLTIQVLQAGAAQSGYLSTTDWNTFNNKLGTSLTSAYIYVGNGSNVATGVAMSGDISITNTGNTQIVAGAIVNADINASAAIAVSKLEALTASRVLGSNGSGVIQALDTATYPSLTELAYVKGVTSAIQTQLNNRLSVTLSSPTNGDVITYNGAAWVNSPSSTGVPTSGTTAQILRKIDNTNYNTEWHTLVAADITDVSSTAAELNKLSGVTTTTAQFNFLNTVSGDVQSQLDAKLASSLTLNNIWVGNVSNIPTQLAAGTNGYVLTSVSGVPTWVSPSTGGTVTSVAASGGTTGMSFTGSPITTSGTLTLTGTLAIANGGTGLTALGTAGQLIKVNAGATALEYFTPAYWALTGSSTLTGNVNILGTGTYNLSLGTFASQLNDFYVYADTNLNLYSAGSGAFSTTSNLGIDSGDNLDLSGTNAVNITSAVSSIAVDGITFLPNLASDVTWLFAAPTSVDVGGFPLTFENGTFALRNVANTFSGFFTNTVTADRTYTLPNASGTVALTSDIVTYTSSNGITKTGNNFALGGSLASPVSITGTQAFSLGGFLNYLTQFNVASDAIDFRIADSGGTSGYRIQGDISNYVFTDYNISKQGIKYAASGYVTDPQSLTDKDYVDTSLGSWLTGTLTGNAVIDNGAAHTFRVGNITGVAATQFELGVSPANVYMDGGGGLVKLELGPTDAAGTALFTDTRTTKVGLQYAVAGYVTTDRSLTDKGYVDGLAGGMLIDAGTPGAGQDGQSLRWNNGTTAWEYFTAGGGGGYTNLTQFVAQTNWRTFYSNGSGDVTELAFGVYGTALKSNSTTSAPAFDYLNPVVTRSLTANNYTLQDIDNGCIVELDNGATAGTITLPTGLPASWNCTVVNRGTGILTLTTSGTTLTSDGTTLEVRYTGTTIYSRGSNAFTAIGALGAPLTLANITGTLPVASGGTNITSYSIGDLIQATGATTLSKLASVSAGSFLRSGGVTTASAWSTVKLPDTMSALGLWVANSANTTVNLTAAAGQSIRVNAGGTAWEAFTPGGSGIGGSTGATDNSILRADGTGGATLQNSGLVIDDSANLTLGISSLAGSDRTITVAGSNANISLLLSSKGDGQIGIATPNTANGNLILYGNNVALGGDTYSVGIGDIDIIGNSSSISGTQGSSFFFRTGNGIVGNANSGNAYLDVGTISGSGKYGNYAFFTDAVSPSSLPDLQDMEKGIAISNRVTVPTAGITNSIAIFAEDVNSSSEFFVYTESTAKVNISGLLEPVTESGTSFSLNETHRNKIVLCTNSGVVTVTVGTGKAAGWNCILLATHATGTISLSASGTTLNGVTSTANQFETLSLVHYGSEVYLSKLG